MFGFLLSPFISIIAGALGLSAIAGFAFYQGYEYCHNSDQVALLQAENQRLKENQTQMQAQLDAANQTDAQWMASEASAMETINALKAQIANTPGNCVYSSQWLRGLDGLK